MFIRKSISKYIFLFSISTFPSPTIFIVISSIFGIIDSLASSSDSLSSSIFMTMSTLMLKAYVSTSLIAIIDFSAISSAVSFSCVNRTYPIQMITRTPTMAATIFLSIFLSVSIVFGLSVCLSVSILFTYRLVHFH